MKVLLAIALLGLLTATYFWERNAMEGLRARNEALRAENLEASQLTDANRELPALRATAGTAKRTDRNELLRLRNDVRRLRALQQEVEKLRAANQRVAHEIKSGKFTPRRLADMEGAVPREKWTFSGLATPEATVQSLLASFASGEMEQFINCMTPNVAAKMRAEMAKDPQSRQRQEEFKKLTAEWVNFSAFRIVQQKQRSPESVLIEIQVTLDGEPMPIPLQRVGNEWKIDLEAEARIGNFKIGRVDAPANPAPP